MFFASSLHFINTFKRTLQNHLNVFANMFTNSNRSTSHCKTHPAPSLPSQTHAGYSCSCTEQQSYSFTLK